MSICSHFHNSTIRSKMLLYFRTFKRDQAWLAFVHLGFTLNPRFRSTGSWRLGEVTGRCVLLFWVSLYKTTHVFKGDWKIVMVTYCSKTNTLAFRTIINQSEKKKKVNVWQKQGRTCKHWRRSELLGWKRSAFKGLVDMIAFWVWSCYVCETLSQR